MSSCFSDSFKNEKNSNRFKFISFFIFILYMYFLIPTEAGSDALSPALLIRSFVSLLFIIFLFSFNGLLKSKKLFTCLFVFFIIYFMAALSSFSLKVFLAFESLLLGVLWANSFSRQSYICENLIYSLKALIYFSCFSLIAQLLMYKFWGYVDLHSLVYPWSEARFQDLGRHIRLGGIYIEPGTLSNWIYSFFLLITIVRGFIDIKLALITALAMAVSLSGWGAAVSAVIIICASLPEKVFAVKNNRIMMNWKVLAVTLLVILIAVFFFFIFITDDILSFLEYKLSFQDGSGDVRLSVYSEYINVLPQLAFWGLGYDPDFCRNCLSVQDAGLFFNFSVIYGLPFTILFFLIIFFASYKNIGWKGVILVFPLLTSKLYYWDFIVLMIFFSSFYRVFLFSKKNKNTIKNKT